MDKSREQGGQGQGERGSPHREKELLLMATAFHSEAMKMFWN